MKKIKVAIVSHRTLPNPIVDNLKIFLFRNYKVRLLDVTHPLLESPNSFRNSSKYEIFENGKLIKTRHGIHWQLPVPILYLKDFIYSLMWVYKFGKMDVYFGVGNMNPIVGIIIRKLGRARKVVYWSMDYFPNRFGNTFLNWIYFQIDKFCVSNVDETWNVSSVMVEARKKTARMDPMIYNKQVTVPGGVWFNETKRLPFEKVDKNKIVYRGGLVDWQGVDLVIRAMPLVLQKLPKVRFEIVGSGADEEKLRVLVKKLKLERWVIFAGLITERGELEEKLRDGALGVATFNTRILDEKVKNADPGKIKDYMVMGMPVIVTNAVYYHQKISMKRCGVVVKYDPRDCAEAIVKLLKNEILLREYRDNALKFIQDFDWNKVLSKNVERILNGFK